MAETAIINTDGQMTLPETIRAAVHVAVGTEFAVEVGPDGTILLRPMRDPEQA